MLTKEETGRRPEGLEFEKTSRHWKPAPGGCVSNYTLKNQLLY
jgi:hypothetical protein